MMNLTFIFVIYGRHSIRKKSNQIQDLIILELSKKHANLKSRKAMLV